MKAILVIDEMPSDCYECDLCVWNIDGWNCKPKRRPIEDEKPLWCPLRSLPTDLVKIEGKWIYKDGTGKAINNSEYVDGWNDCLDAILGETE